MVTIRLFRTGTRKRASYRVIAIDSRRKRQGRPLDVLGTYAPRGAGGVTQIDTAKYDAWISKGAQASDTVKSLVRRQRAGKAEVSVEDAAPASADPVPVPDPAESAPVETPEASEEAPAEAPEAGEG